MAPTWLVILGVLGFFAARYFTKHYLKKPKKNTKVSNERFMQNRNQTMRLSELRTLNERLDKSKSETSSLEKSVQRLDLVLSELEKIN